jgi:phage tail-like protein
VSARRGVPSLGPRYSLLEGLPALFHGDAFIVGLVGGFDEVLAPMQATVDDLDAYVDPHLCPPDFLEWLGGWMGLAVDRRWPIQRRRELVARAFDVYRWRGTRRGIEEAVELYTGIVPDVEESGGVSTSPSPLGPFPGSRERFVHVRLHTSDATIDAAVVSRIVADVKPAHVPHRVEVVVVP